MQKIILLSLFLLTSAVTASAQTQTAQDLYAKASKPGANIDKIIRTEAGKADSTSCHDLAVMFYRAEDYTHAAACWDLARQKVIKYGKNYEKMLNFMALCYDETDDTRGMTHVMALMEEHNQHELTLPCDEPECMVERAEYYSVTGDNAKAKECYLQALQMPMSDYRKSLVYESFATFNAGVNEFASASEYYFMAANARKAVEGETEDYIQLVYKTAVYGYLGKRYEQSLGYYRQVISYYDNQDSDAARKNIANCHKGMGNSLSAMQDFAAARDEHRLVVEYYERYDKSDEEYPNSIVRVATAEKFNKEYDASIEHYKQAIAIYMERGLVEKAQETQTSLNMCYVYAGKPMEDNEEVEKAARLAQNEKLDALIREEEENLEIYRKYLGELQYASSLGTIAGCYYAKEEYAQSVAYFKQYIGAVRDAIRDEFRMQSEAERMTAWDDQKTNIEDILDMLVTLPVGNEALMPDLSALAYDCMLLSKGILLNSSIEFEKVVNASDDSKLRTTYAEIKQINAELLQLRQVASSEKDLERILKLQQKSQQKQLDLNLGCAEVADFTDYIGYSWKDVQAELQKGDIAIEFAAIDMGVFDDDNWIVALILTKDMKAPEAMPICSFAQARQMQNDVQLCSGTEFGQMVWGRLSQYIGNRNRIFFSADGAFNQIGIEYLLFDGRPLSEQKDVIRLSTTKELCYHSPETKIESAALFGDINYNEEGTYTAETQRQVASMRGAGAMADDDAPQFGNLEATRREINDIAGTLKSAGVGNVQTFTDTKASEEAFIDLSDTKVNLLHIATHGAYLADGKVSDAESMQQSILAFARANLGRNGSTADGYVTAADVAKMNLRNCKLAVLSACETALGKMGNDGVFGLQRGFKNAGVHTILMSLRKVDDDATTELMTQFYKHLMDGSTPNEALRKAQRHLRSNGYDDPEYWTSFIILDGNR